MDSNCTKKNETEVSRMKTNPQQSRTTKSTTAEGLNHPPTVKELGTKARNRFHEIKANRLKIVRITETDVPLGVIGSTVKASNFQHAVTDDYGHNNQQQGAGKSDGTELRPGLSFMNSIKKPTQRKRRRQRSLNSDKVDIGNRNSTSTTIVDDWIPNVSHLPSERSVPHEENQLEENKKRKCGYSHVVQLHGLPKNTTFNSIRRFFSGLALLRVVVLLPLENGKLRIDEWDAKQEDVEDGGNIGTGIRQQTSKKKKSDGNCRRIERYESSVRVWVQFDSTPTASIACKRSKEHINAVILSSCQKEAHKNPNYTIPVQDGDSDSDNHCDSKRLVNESEKQIVSNRVSQTGKAAIGVIPVPTKRVAKYVMNTIAVDVRHVVGQMISDDTNERITNDTPLEKILIWIQGTVDSKVTKVLWAATIHDLQLTCSFETIKKSRNQTDKLNLDNCSLFPLFLQQAVNSKNPSYSAITSPRIYGTITDDELNVLSNHRSFLEGTLLEIELANRSLLLLSMDLSCTNPIIAMTLTAIQIIKKQVEYLSYKILLSQRLAILDED